MHAELIRIARAEVGVREDAGMNNQGAQIRLYQSAVKGLDPGPWAWCAAFTSWVLREWLLTPEGRAYLGTHKPAEWRCATARAFDWEKWATAKGLVLLPESQLAKAGDFVTFDFSHIGIVVEDQPTIRTPIVTVEGNTNGKGERDSTSGDGVWLKNRAPGLVRRYIRLGTKAP